MVQDCSAILKRFYFLERELVKMQAGWMPGTEHLESKFWLGESLWKDSLVAKDLRERVLELRYPDSRVVVGDDQPFIDFVLKFQKAPNALAFLMGLTRILKPLIKNHFTKYLELADQLDDAPTIRILKYGMADLNEQIASSEKVITEFAAIYPEYAEIADSWVQLLKKTVDTSKDIFFEAEGFRIPVLHLSSPSFEISRYGKRDRSFAQALFPWPDSLEPARGAGCGSELQIRQAVHHINEVWAAEMAASVIFDLTEDAPSDFLIDAARWCYDEIRHCRMGYTRLLTWGFRKEEIPLGSFSYEAGADVDPVTRLGIIYYFESTYIHTKSERTKTFAKCGDRMSSHDMDFDWADELIHTYYGTRWLKYFLEKKGDIRTPNQVRQESEKCIATIRQRATDKQREECEGGYRRMLNRGRELGFVDNSERVSAVTNGDSHNFRG
jgi:uncharacterized ferritin-like protein (DUF455 family)